mmetsp:Transcript_7647/g.28150  ORF Transcript_7647/g.28150 Transcript_7647/m.28150 type:complete len:281 (+) Transcript_7647:4519-5361(+)
MRLLLLLLLPRLRLLHLWRDLHVAQRHAPPRGKRRRRRRGGRRGLRARGRHPPAAAATQVERQGGEQERRRQHELGRLRRHHALHARPCQRSPGGVPAVVDQRQREQHANEARQRPHNNSLPRVPPTLRWRGRRLLLPRAVGRSPVGRAATARRPRSGVPRLPRARTVLRGCRLAALARSGALARQPALRWLGGAPDRHIDVAATLAGVGHVELPLLLEHLVPHQVTRASPGRREPRVQRRRRRRQRRHSGHGEEDPGQSSRRLGAASAARLQGVLLRVR